MVKGRKLTKQQRYYRKNKGKYRKYAKKRKEIAETNLKALEKETKKKDSKKKLNKHKNTQKNLRRKKAVYFIVTIRNNKPYKIFNRYVDYSWASKKWDDLLEEQKTLFYPGKKYPLMFLYKVNLGEENIVTERNDIGKLIETKIPGYKIIFHDIYHSEKNVFFKNKRKTVPAKFILDLLNFNDNIKQCFLIKNKICVEDEGKYFLFSCSDVNTAIGIKNKLREMIMDMGKTNILFFNDVSSINMKSEIYDKIVEQGICQRIYLMRNDF
jgi:hypothetical protein